MLPTARHRFAFVLCLWALAPVAFAAVPALDPTFGTGGKVVARADGWVNGIAIQADGKPVIFDSYVTGSFVLMGLHYFYTDSIARLDTSGAVDQSFSNGGIFPSLSVSRLLVQHDGGMLAVGRPTAPCFVCISLRLARYRADGSLDQEFTSAATAALSGIYGSGKPYASFNFSDIALQGDGKIVVVGTLFNPGGGTAVVRFNADGTIDRTFAGAGYAVYLGLNAQKAGPVVVQPSGKIVVGLTSFDGRGTAAFLLQFNADGTLDSGFGDRGRSTFPGASITYSTFDNLVRQPNGDVVAAVTFGVATAYAYPLRRFRPDGTLDSSFGIDGVTDLWANAAYNRLLVLPDGKLLVAGAAYDSGAGRPVAQILRFTANGLVDGSFGGSGGTPPPFVVDQMVLGPDGNFFVSGQAPCALSYCFSEPSGSPAVAHYIGGSTAAVEFYNATLDH
jgi:uncharacterized delta-60 repeat protein